MKDLLIKVRELIRQGWCQGTMAIDANGEAVPSMSDKACKYCLLGAWLAARHRLGEVTPTYHFENLVNHLTGAPNIPIWNDTDFRTQQDVLDLLDEMVRICEQA